MVPVRGVAEHLGATVEWDDATKLITVVLGDRTVKMTLGSANYTVNDEQKVLDVIPEVVEGRTFIPLRAMAEAIGKEVYWSEAPNAAEGGNGLIVIGHKADPFFECDANAVEMLRTMLGIPEQYPQRPAQPEKDFVVKVVIPTLSDTNRIQADSIVASAEPEMSQGHGATAASDGDFNDDSRWAADGNGVNITFEYEQAQSIGQVSLTFWKPLQRTTNFKLEYTTDNSTWVTVFDGASTLGKEQEIFDINQTVKKFRITGNGNSENTWFSLIEFCAYKPGVSAGTANVSTTTTTTTTATTQATTTTSATGTKVALSTANVKFSQEPESQNPGRHCLDGTEGTVWASQGVGCTATVDLSSSKTVSSVGVKFKLYEDARTIPYHVELSDDGSTWSKVYSGNSVASSNAKIYLAINQSARYVRFTFDGNTTSQWNSVDEIEVYTN
ncbi:MAG: stalk domain-containing protein [Clostridia bacterium]|nr:stalk domain-containing protein [Clostridia bacterium]